MIRVIDEELCLMCKEFLGCRWERGERLNGKMGRGNYYVGYIEGVCTVGKWMRGRSGRSDLSLRGR